MSTAQLRRLAPNRWQLAGAVNLAAVSTLAVGEAPCATNDTVELDLAAVETSSSAAVALLLHWRELAQRAGGRLVLRNCPEPLRRIAALSNVDSLLGLDIAA